MNDKRKMIKRSFGTCLASKQHSMHFEVEQNMYYDYLHCLGICRKSCRENTPCANKIEKCIIYLEEIKKMQGVIVTTYGQLDGRE